MHPELFRFQLLTETLPLRPVLLALAACLAGLGWRLRNKLSTAQKALWVVCSGGLAAFAAALHSWELQGSPVSISTFGALLGGGVLLAGWLTQRRAGALGLTPRRSLQSTVWSTATGLACALLATPSQWAVVPALFGAALAARVCWPSRKHLRTWLDAATPGALLTVALFHLGTYCFGSHYGIPLNDPESWLAALGRFPHWDNHLGAPAWSAQVKALQLPFASRTSLAVHPVQLYALLGTLLIAGGSDRALRKQRFHGQLFLQAGLLYTLLEWLLLAPTHLPVHTLPPQWSLVAATGVQLALWLHWSRSSVAAPLPLGKS